MTKEKNESAEELFRAEGKVNIGIYHSGGQKQFETKDGFQQPEKVHNIWNGQINMLTTALKYMISQWFKHALLFWFSFNFFYSFFFFVK